MIDVKTLLPKADLIRPAVDANGCQYGDRNYYSEETVIKLLGEVINKSAAIADLTHPHDWARIGTAIRNQKFTFNL